MSDAATVTVAIYVDPRRGAEIDAFCVFWRADWDRARVARLVGMSADTWHVEQLNPLRLDELARSEWPYAHRITGTYTP
jgi:hypothetical protein